MVDLAWKAKMVSSDIPNNSPRLSNKLNVLIPTPAPFRGVTNVSPVSASDSACSAYDHYFRLPELRKLWSSKEFPDWRNESILKPALQALEITFRLVSTVLSDPRPYVNRREWKRKLESLATSQIQLIALFCEDLEARGTAPIVDLTSSTGVLARDRSYTEVWKVSPETTVVNRYSEASFLPRLAAWETAEDIAQKILYSIECEMRSCPYTLGLGEPNLAGKPNLDYDAVCKPNDVHNLNKNPYEQIHNHENQTLYTTHQILESWIQVTKEVIKRVIERIEAKKFEMASSDCYMLERIWKLLSEIEDLHLLMDPDDFLKLKNQLLMRSLDETEAFCFRSRSLVEITKSCKELKHKVPEILDVEVDPKGGPRVQEAAMRLYSEKIDSEKIHLLQGLQATEAALKKFFYGYKQMLVVVMGSLEAKGNRVLANAESDSLSQLFLEPTYFPSLDAAKTFLGEFWNHEQRVSENKNRRK
ncbi:nematode resistance protein-like HSPRO2 [Euphorbia lathyris]|uniref:nematode resistance protein-like HSPRO2 n=1 Tax=Euphorbia lathyris TaxID=212925 RepID=UPI003313B814